MEVNPTYVFVGYLIMMHLRDKNQALENKNAISQNNPKTPENSAESEQVISQAELESYIEEQAQSIAPEIFSTIEISFYDHEVYAGEKLIASITHDHDDFATQRWVVMVNNIEIHRANTWAKCYDYIIWHYKKGTLPEELQEEVISTENEDMAQIAAECDKYGFELCDSDIYYNDIKLGEVSCIKGKWWVLRKSSKHQLQIKCDSVIYAVWCLWKLTTQTANCEELLDYPFDELRSREWQQLKEHKPFPNHELIAA